MEFKLKTISKAGIPEAISKAELYRSLNETGRSRIDLPRHPGS